MASAEYLQRYLSTGQGNTASDYASKSEKKSKKSKKKSSKHSERVKRVSNVQIVDNDVDAANSFLSHLSKRRDDDDDDVRRVDEDEAALAQVLANDPNRVLDDGPAIVDESELRGRVDFGDRPASRADRNVRHARRAASSTRFRVEQSRCFASAKKSASR
jgi:hypothetical protein